MGTQTMLSATKGAYSPGLGTGARARSLLLHVQKPLCPQHIFDVSGRLAQEWFMVKKLKKKNIYIFLLVRKLKAEANILDYLG